ncbi:MAG: hypothetical protein OEX07_08400 [Gammaproteobacteria bacterium]|nr:hypothetical protein [Gammaproteobacteria bacterium]
MTNINNPDNIDSADSRNNNPAEIRISESANKVTSNLDNGKQCELYDNTGLIPDTELKELLDQLVQDRLFGINALSSSDGIIYLDKPKLSHIQINDDLYRLYLYRYHAIIENF